MLLQNSGKYLPVNMTKHSKRLEIFTNIVVTPHHLTMLKLICKLDNKQLKVDTFTLIYNTKNFTEFCTHKPCAHVNE